MSTGTVYNGHDNVVPILLTDEGEPANLRNMTKVQVMLAGQSFDSDVNPAMFDLAAREDGIIGLKFGAAELPADDHPMRVVVFDNANPKGIVWLHERDAVKRNLRVVSSDPQ